eukprot:g41747.t1
MNAYGLQQNLCNQTPSRCFLPDVKVEDISSGLERNDPVFVVHVDSNAIRLPGHCGEYGCDMSCNHGGCEEISRVCPVGFAMIETSNGISCK